MARLEIEGLKERKPRKGLRFFVLILGVLGFVFVAVICGRNLNESSKSQGSKKRRGASTNKREESFGRQDFPQWSPPKGKAPSEPLPRIRPSSYSTGIWKQVTEISPGLIDFRRKLHGHPELANRETKTAKFMAEQFRKLGFKVKEGLALTGVTALLRGARKGPTVAVLAAMDGVSVREKNEISFASKRKGTINGKKVWVSHAAGRDVEMAVMLGVAKILAQHQSVMPGNVKFILQPAGQGPPKGEEGGARALILHGVLGNPKVEALFALAVQPDMRIGRIGMPEDRWWRGMTHFRILVGGTGLESCLRPNSGGCVDPILVASQLVVSLQTQLPRQVASKEGVRLTVGAMKADARKGRLPQSVTLRGTIRWKQRSDAISALAFVRRTVKGTAVSSRARIQVRFQEGDRMTPSDPEMVRWILPTARRVLGPHGVTFGSVGIEAENFSVFRKHVPAVLMQLGTHSQKLGKKRRLRSPHFNVDEECISVGVHFLSNVVLDYLLDHGGSSTAETKRSSNTP